MVDGCRLDLLGRSGGNILDDLIKKMSRAALADARSLTAFSGSSTETCDMYSCFGHLLLFVSNIMQFDVE
jgi:hypothetical protein